MFKGFALMCLTWVVVQTDGMLICALTTSLVWSDNVYTCMYIFVMDVHDVMSVRQTKLQALRVKIAYPCV